jgi:folate-binding protein YgfZ
VKSPLADLTDSCGARTAAFAQWQMPAHYGDSACEHEAASSGAVIRDLSHWTRLTLTGADHLDFIHRMTTNDIVHLRPGDGCAAVFADNRGRIVELVDLVRTTEPSTLVMASPPARERLPAWLDRFLFVEKVEVEDITGATAMVEIWGPHAADAIRTALGFDADAAENSGLLSAVGASGPWVIRSARHHGNTGVRLVGDPPAIARHWRALLQQGVAPIGEEAAEILRVEAGTPAFESELTDEHNPWEAGLEDAIHMDKGCYIGQEVIARLDTYDKVKQRLVGLRLAGGPPPERGTAVKAGDRQVGKITSATRSPLLKCVIALAYIRNTHGAPGTPLVISSSSSESPDIDAEVIELPVPAGA